MTAVKKTPHVLITGGSRGIGLAIAQLFAKNKYRCTLISRSEEELKAAVATLQTGTNTPATTTTLSKSKPVESFEDALARLEAEAHGSSGKRSKSKVSKPTKPIKPINTTVTTTPITTDPTLQHAYIVGDVVEWKNFWSKSPITGKANTKSFEEQMPRPPSREENHPSIIDVLVNCAGMGQASLFMAMAEHNIDELVNTNLTGMMAGTQFLLRKQYIRNLRSSWSGRSDPLGRENSTGSSRTGSSPVIINISSLLGLSGGYGAVAYAASKAGVLGFTRALATEYASHRVRVNTILPGYISTDMTKDLDSSSLSAKIPLQRFGTPEEVAHAALFLAQNEYAHNCTLNLDGGLSAV